MISRLLWWLLSYLARDGVRMTDEMFEATLAAIREDGEAMNA